MAFWVNAIFNDGLFDGKQVSQWKSRCGGYRRPLFMVKRHLRKKATGYFHGYFENIVLLALMQALNHTKVVYYEISGIAGLANLSNAIAHTDTLCWPLGGRSWARGALTITICINQSSLFANIRYVDILKNCHPINAHDSQPVTIIYTGIDLRMKKCKISLVYTSVFSVLIIAIW